MDFEAPQARRQAAQTLRAALAAKRKERVLDNLFGVLGTLFVVALGTLVPDWDFQRLIFLVAMKAGVEARTWAADTTARKVAELTSHLERIEEKDRSGA